MYSNDHNTAFTPVVSEHSRIGRYRVIRKLASGGMASVFLAALDTQGGVSKWFALKVAHPHLNDQPRFVQMFLQEARVASRIDHSNVCSVIEFGESPQGAFIAMEYLHGQPLSTVVRRAAKDSPMPMPIVVRIIADAARGLHAAHELKDGQGASLDVVHRDVSPHNIFVLYQGATKVVDFGIARCNDAVGEGTRTGEWKGKVAYMCPEQIRGQRVDRRADVFSLGVVLWECLAGQRLFKRESDIATVTAVLAGEVSPFASVGAAVPAELEAIVHRALANDPTRRYATAEALADDLEDWLAAQGRASGSAQVGSWMKQTFAAEMQAADELLRAGRGRIESTSSAPAPDEPSKTTAPAVHSTAPAAPRTSPPFAIAALVAVGVISFGAAAVKLRTHLADASTPAPRQAIEQRPTPNTTNDTPSDRAAPSTNTAAATPIVPHEQQDGAVATQPAQTQTAAVATQPAQTQSAMVNAAARIDAGARRATRAIPRHGGLMTDYN